MTESSQDEQVVDPAAPEAPAATGEQDVPAPRPEAPGPASDSESGPESGVERAEAAAAAVNSWSACSA